MTFALRYYQQDAVDAIWSAVKSGTRSPLAILPTGAGKTAVVAQLVKDALQWGGKVLVAVHTKELVEQLRDGIKYHCGDDVPLGVMSAGLRSRKVDQVTVAGIQTAYRRACEIGARNVLIIDEAHMIPPDGDGMYRRLISDLLVINPKMIIVGLTATPYRLTTGVIFGNGSNFEKVVYDAGVRRLIDEGFLSPLRGKNGGNPDLKGVHRRGGEYIAEELEACMSDSEKVGKAVEEALRHGSDRKAWLVFCCGVKHAELVKDALVTAGIHSEIITGETPVAKRDDTIRRYKDGGIRALVNVNVLTTGFDAPHIDMILMLRPTDSAGLYYQMMGRGLRKAPTKVDCLVLDMAGNIERHGPIDVLNDRVTAKRSDGDKEPGVPPMKTCPQCEESILAAMRTCPCCDYEFPIEEAKHSTTASNASPISDPRWVNVTGIIYREWAKKGAGDDHPKTLCVSYFDGIIMEAREWVCVEHPHGGYAGRKAIEWIEERLLPGWVVEFDCGYVVVSTDGDKYPINAQSVAAVAGSALKCPTKIKLVPDGKYERVCEYMYGDDDTCAGIEEIFDYASYDGEEPPF